MGDKRRGMTFTSPSSPCTVNGSLSLSIYVFFFLVCLFVYSGCTWSLRILASYFLSLSLSPHSWSAGACFLSAPTMGGLLGSRCLRPWKRKSVQADEKYISLKTPLPFPWPLPCIYNPSFAASQAKYVTFTSFSFFSLSLPLSQIQFSGNTAGLMERGWGGLAEFRKLCWEEAGGSFVSYLTCKTTQELLDSWSEWTLGRGESPPVTGLKIFKWDHT